MLKRVLIVLMASLFLATVGMVAARAQVGEILYLSDSSTNTVGTYLYQVNLDDTNLHANLTLLPSGLIDFNQVDALAHYDGKLWCIDKYGDSAHPGTGKLGYYDISTAAFVEIGYVRDAAGGIIPGIVLAAFSPDGTLYAASENTDSLYTVNLTTAAATLKGIIRNAAGTTINVSGADIVFGADGTLYLWCNNAGGSGAPRGLYTLDLSVIGAVTATHRGAGGSGSYYTGLAIRANGLGDLVGSTHEDEISVVDKTDGSTVTIFMMYKDGSRYNYEYGDMTAGPLEICTKTIGYWKNHSWEGKVAIINGDIITESIGRGTNKNGILWNATGNNHSMLYAQLVAALLNINNASGFPPTDSALQYLYEYGIGLSNYNAPFSSKQQRRYANFLKNSLDEFNMGFECEEETR